MVPQSKLSSAARCVMVVLGEGMCDVYYMQIFCCADRQIFSLQKKREREKKRENLLSNHLLGLDFSLYLL